MRDQEGNTLVVVKSGDLGGILVPEGEMEPLSAFVESHGHKVISKHEAISITEPDKTTTTTTFELLVVAGDLNDVQKHLDDVKGPIPEQETKESE